LVFCNWAPRKCNRTAGNMSRPVFPDPHLHPGPAYRDCRIRRRLR
jgi:hypothetical protein